jgi:hypothetical protein
LRAHPGWQNDERALAANRVFGVALWQRRLDFAARLDPASRTIAAERLCAFVLDAERATLALASEGSGLSMQAASEIARSLAAPSAWPADPVARLAVKRSGQRARERGRAPPLPRIRSSARSVGEILLPLVGPSFISHAARPEDRSIARFLVRVYVAIAELRTLGLRDVIVRGDDGYRIGSSVRMCREAE